MAYGKGSRVSSSMGELETDSSGCPVGVVRMDPSSAYPGIGELLQMYIHTADPAAWETIRAKIDFTYQNLDWALAALDAETGFSGEVRAHVASGCKLLFKPNLVTVFDNIDPQNHAPGKGQTACTEWPFLAALMRWFHDKPGIRYHQMAVGEASTTTSATANLFSLMHPERRPITPQAVIEGRSGDFYGGWGFYFARKYLSETPGRSGTDDPMAGYDESVAGTYVPPGLACDWLMVYDLNRICDEPGKGRDIQVPGGVNFPSVTLHKVVVGGDPHDEADRKLYPGCVLVNVPKLKVHNYALFTNAIKNLGIGLYPMQAAAHDAGERLRWKYGLPHTDVPGLKAVLPHSPWVPERLDEVSGIALRDEDGRYRVRKTGGLLATMIDVIQAVRSQGIFMLHVVDAIEAINLDHSGTLPGTKQPEGLVFAGLDPVATDLLCARYLFTTVPIMHESQALGESGRFLQAVPVPTVEGANIVTRTGYDCPLDRDISFQYAEERGLGQQAYYVVGKDVMEGCPMASWRGHPGRVKDGKFAELITGTLYFDIFKMPWDLQLTTFRYFEAVDRLTGSSWRRDFLESFDEDADGVVGYEEFGKNGLVGSLLAMVATMVVRTASERFGYHPANFASMATLLKVGNEDWNQEGHDLTKGFNQGAVCLTAYMMSLVDTEAQDPFLPSLTWGKGKWPSYQLAHFVHVGSYLYGPEFPNGAGFASLYAHALYYADLCQHDGRYAGWPHLRPDPRGAQRYIDDVLSGAVEPRDFILYVPPGYGMIGGRQVPNVVETSDRAKVFTAVLAGGDVWPRESLGAAVEPHLAMAT